jgi:hypothetical protein
LVAVMLVVIVRVGATIVYAAGFEGGDDAVYERLYNKYYDAYFNLFRVATDNVLGQPPLSIKLRGWSGFPMKVWKGKGKYYAQMLVEIRADAFDKTDLSVDEIAQRLPWVWGSNPPKKSSREVIGELAMRIMFLYEFQERRKAVAVQPHHIRYAETLAVFAQVRTSPHLFDNFLGGCVVSFEAA